jgi:two-component system, cell cycle response regulator DivK
LTLQSGTAPEPAPADPLVLIVEDDQGTRALYRDFLSTSGFRIAEAHNGFQALEKAQQLEPDVILTDLAVPGLDGFTFGRALRQSAATREIPILAVTGHAEYLDQSERVRQAGIAHVLLKPCPLDVIARELRRLIDSGRDLDAGGDASRRTG